MKSVAIKNKLTIRTACQKDKAKIAQVVCQAFAEYRQGKNTSHLKEDLVDIAGDIEKNEVLVLEVREKIIGSLRLQALENNIYYLKRFAIHPQHQGQGLGLTLFEAAEKFVKNNNGRKIHLHSSTEDDRLIRFYKKLGFRCKKIETNVGYARGLWIKELKSMEQDIYGFKRINN